MIFVDKLFIKVILLFISPSSSVPLYINYKTLLLIFYFF